MFQTIENYQETINAPDSDLPILLSRPCGPLEAGNYEDELNQILLHIFRYATGVPWVRAFENGSRPTEPLTQVKDGQYGTIFLMGMKPIGSPYLYDGLVNDENDICESYVTQHMFNFQLDVYRDAGEATRGQENDMIQTPVGSAIDVLSRLKMRLHHRVFKDSLKEYCIQYASNAISEIRNLPPEKIKETYETRATCDFSIYALVSSKMRIPGTPFPPDFQACPCPDKPEPDPIFDQYGCLINP